LQAGGRRFNPVRLHQRFKAMRGWRELKANKYGSEKQDEIVWSRNARDEESGRAWLCSVRLFDMVKRV
jgi:hypothetical protein